MFFIKDEKEHVFIFSEENIWKLCQDVATRHPSELQHCHVVFVSNSRRSVPLWRQRAGKDEDKLVVWVSICRSMIINQGNTHPFHINISHMHCLCVGLPCYSHLCARWKGSGIRFREFPAVPYAFLEICHRNLQIWWSIAAWISQKIPSGTCQRIFATVCIKSASYEAQGWHMD